MARETGDCFSFYFCLSFERSFVGVICMRASQHTSKHQQNSMRDMSPKRIPCCLHTCCPICHGPLVFLAEQQPCCETRSCSIHVSLSLPSPALLFSRSLNAPNRGSRVRRAEAAAAARHTGSRHICILFICCCSSGRRS